jgi:hypothetical protein
MDRFLMMPLLALMFLLCAQSLHASEETAPSQRLIEEIRAANKARAARTAEAAAWAGERDRLDALRTAVEAETSRLNREADTSMAHHAQTSAELAHLAATDEVTTMRHGLAALTATIRTHLAALAATGLPGTVTVPTAGGDLPGALAALDATEQAATAVQVDIVTGRLAGTERAVRLLRVAGAAAWWASLDPADPQGGTAAMVAGELHLTPIADPHAIRQAIAEADGRAPPGITWLPLAMPEAP